MTPPRPAGDGERHERVAADFDAKYRRCEEHNRARYYCGCYYADLRPASPPAGAEGLRTRPSEPTVEADLAELAALRAKVARVEALADGYDEAAELCDRIAANASKIYQQHEAEEAARDFRNRSGAIRNALDC